MPRSQIFRTTKSMDFSSLLVLSLLFSPTPASYTLSASSNDEFERMPGKNRLRVKAWKPSATAGSFGFCQPIVCRHHLRDMIYP